MVELSDDKLTENGFDAPAIDAGVSVLVIACGALAREILALIKLNQWTHMSLKCLPAKYHLYPEKITEEVEKAVESNRGDFDKIFIAYADCGTGGLLEAKCAELGVEMISGPHCYSFFEGNVTFEENEDDLGTFYLTDFLAKQFDAFVWKPMGLDKHPELLDMYFGHYTKLVYQAQTEDPRIQDIAKKCAERLGLEYEYRFTGYGDLEKALKTVS